MISYAIIFLCRKLRLSEKMKKFFIKILSAILVLILICALIWFLPATRKLLIQIYEENFVVKSLVDIVAMLVNGIKNTFK